MKKWNGMIAAQGCCTCIGQGDCKKWIKEIGKRDCGLDFDCAYAHKEECLGFLKYWDDKNGSIDEWRRNNIPMMKYDADCRSCSTCMGYSHCSAWLHEIKMGHIAAESGHGCAGYANKSQTEALLKWHDNRYQSQVPARADSAHGPERIHKNYVRRMWLNENNSPSTGSVCAFDGMTRYRDDEMQTSRFLEIADCHSKVRLHMSPNDTDAQFICKMIDLRDFISDFIAHLTNKDHA